MCAKVMIQPFIFVESAQFSSRKASGTERFLKVGRDFTIR